MLVWLSHSSREVRRVRSGRVSGSVDGSASVAVAIKGIAKQVRIGDHLEMSAASGCVEVVEVVGFRGDTCFGMTYGHSVGVGSGKIVTASVPPRPSALNVDDSWIGRVIDPFGRPLDSLGLLATGKVSYALRRSAPAAGQRGRLGPRLDVGIRALNAFATCRAGQRLGLFAGSGVGKSTLIAMMAKYTMCDVVVVALVGERGREVREFLEDDLGAAGLARSIVVVATSDMPSLTRRDAAYTAMTVAEHFRNNGKNVLLLMDSVTRFCTALREIALAAGEPPSTRGFPSGIFSELPRLFERAGPGLQRPGQVGQITAIFTVLVDGDDHNEPISDAVRGLLDGHVILDRAIADQGRFPAIDVLRSLSRTAFGCNSPDEQELVRRARTILSKYLEMKDLFRVGGYRAGTDPDVDNALYLGPLIERSLYQRKNDCTAIKDTFSALRLILFGNVAVCKENANLIDSDLGP
jgi:flagellum-specific ATP synthase